MAKLRESRPPLEEAGIEAEAESVLQAMLTTYASGDEATRAAIGGMLDRYTSFRWAAVLPFEPTRPSDPRRSSSLFLNLCVVCGRLVPRVIGPLGFAAVVGDR